MKRTNSENQIIREPDGGKLDPTNLSALADSMQFLSLGVPGISRPKKFNVNAWSTPLKSIENQQSQRRLPCEKICEIGSTDDDSLSNLTDLFPGQNSFEKTFDFIEYYRVNSPQESNCTPPGDRTGSSATAHATLSPIESMVAGFSISKSNSNSSSNEELASCSQSSVGLSDVVESRFLSPPSTEKCESPVTERSSERLSTGTKCFEKANKTPSNVTISPSLLESFDRASLDPGDTDSGDATSKEEPGSLPPTSTTSPVDRTLLLATAPSTGPRRSETGQTFDYSSHVSYSESSVECHSLSGDECFEDCVESQHSSFSALHPAAEKSTKTPRSECSDCDRSFVLNFLDLEGSPAQEDELSAECEVENKYDAQESVSMEKTTEIWTAAQQPVLQSDDHPSKHSPTPPSDLLERSSADVINKRVEVGFEIEKFHDVVNNAVSISTNEPTLHQQPKTSNSLLETPPKHDYQEPNLPSEKLARVCVSMNKLLSLCTPMKDLRTQCQTPINPFRCENVGSERQKIIFDCPTSLLDVSIGMLESMTAMMAPVESASNVTYLDEQNTASDLINVAQTPKVIHTQPNQTSSSSRPIVSNIDEHLVEENENLSKELEEYKKKYDILRGEYESVLKLAYALRTNETTLKKALQEYEDETRKACNKYHILKEYADTLIISLNRSLDQYEEELKMKNDELKKLKGSS